MAEPTLAQVFGPNASQTATQLIISKADLATVGLTASAGNTAESLTVALMLRAAQYLKDLNQQSDPDIQVTIMDSGFPQLISRNSQTYRQITYNINLQTPDAGSSIDPDNY